MFMLKALQKVQKTLGSRATATLPHAKLRPTFKPLLEVLESRVLLNNDVLIWNPTDGTSLASHAANWYDQTQGRQGVEAPGIGDGVGAQVWLSSYKSNTPITWDESVTVFDILLTGGGGAGGGGGYTALQTINSGVVITASNGVDTSGNPSLNVRLVDSGSELDSAGGSNQWTNFSISGLGTLVISGGSVTIGNNSGYSENFGSDVIVENGGSMIDNSQSLCGFGNQNSNLFFRIDSQSSFDLASGPNSTNNLINSSTSNNYFDVNGGTFAYNYNANSGGTTDYIGAGIVVENGGVLSVAGGGSAPGGGDWLTFDGTYTDPNTQITSSAYVTGGSVQLSGYGTLQCTHDYYQSGGTLESMDASAVTLQDGATGSLGTLNIVGGDVMIAQDPSQTLYGTLTINCNTLNFSGTYAPKVNAGTSGQSDTLIVNGTLNLNAGSTLSVVVIGNLDPAKKGTETWTIIQGASNNLNAFSTNNDQMTGLTDTPNLPDQGDYQVSW